MDLEGDTVCFGVSLERKGERRACMCGSTNGTYADSTSSRQPRCSRTSTNVRIYIKSKAEKRRVEAVEGWFMVGVMHLVC
jgi:hypothetical protein